MVAALEAMLGPHEPGLHAMVCGKVPNQRPTLPPVRSKIHNPRILLLDCPLEYKKGENQTNVELMREEDW